MKIQTTISDISRETIVNLLSTAFFGSSYLSLSYDSVEYKQLPNADEYDCYERKCAKLLLAGKTIEVGDRYAEDETDFYGNLPHEWDGDVYTMYYTVSLDDIRRGLENILNNHKEYAKYVNQLMDEDCAEFDLTSADCLIQFIVFGDYIYG